MLQPTSLENYFKGQNKSKMKRENHHQITLFGRIDMLPLCSEMCRVNVDFLPNIEWMYF